MDPGKRTGVMTIHHSSHTYDLRSRSRSPLNDGALSRAEIEQRDYQLAKELQEEEDRLRCQMERTLDAAEIEAILGPDSLSPERGRRSTRARRGSCGQFVRQRQSLSNSDQEIGYENSSSSDDDDADDSDDESENEMSEEGELEESDNSVLEEQIRHDAGLSDESRMQSSEHGDDDDDNDERDEEDNVEDRNGDAASDSNSEMETMPPQSVIEHRLSNVGMDLTSSLRSVGDRFLNVLQEVQRLRSVIVDVFDSIQDDDEPDDTVIRSVDFGRCNICFEEIPYDPVGCLYCQQMIGCRRCVNKWYRGVRCLNNSEDDLMGGHPPTNHKQCPLCRHEWEDQMEVTSMFYLCDSLPQ